MGLIQAVSGSIGGMLADQWKDFYAGAEGLAATAALFAAVPQGTNAGRGSNTKVTGTVRRSCGKDTDCCCSSDGARSPDSPQEPADTSGVQRHQLEVGLRGRRPRESPDHAELERFKFGGQPGFAAGGLLRLAQGARAESASAPNRRSTGTTASNTQVGAVARAVPTRSRSSIPFCSRRTSCRPPTCSPARCSTSPTWKTPPPASSSTKWWARSTCVQPLHE